MQVSRWRERYAQSQLAGIERDLPRGASPVKLGVSRLMDARLQCNGTTTRFAALNVLDGQVIAQCQSRHRPTEWLKETMLIEVVFARYNEQLAQDDGVRAVQMFDATFIEVARQRNGRKENAKITAGEKSAEWLEESAKPMRRQKSVDAHWTKKIERNATATKTTSMPTMATNWHSKSVDCRQEKSGSEQELHLIGERVL